MSDQHQVAPKHPIVVFRERLESRLGELRMALPAHISPERFMRAVLTSVQINPDILACEFASVWNACLRACNDGLIPDGTEAAIVPFKNKAQYLPMYQGLLKRFRNSGEFKHVNAGIVREGDEYDHWMDEQGEHFRYRRGPDHDNQPIKCVFATATTKEGGFFIVDLSPAQVDKRRAMSRATREDAPWRQWPEEMQLKTALRMLSKYLPKSSDLDVLLKRDEDALLGVETNKDIATTDTIGNLRGAAVGNVLDHFAETKSEPATSVSGAAVEASVGRSQSSATTEASGAGTPNAAVSSTGPAPPSTDPAEVARRQGREAYKAGKKRREVPEEYRAPGSGALAMGPMNVSLALNWTEGWDAEQADEQRR